jgi:hypothetical protein
VKVLLELFVDDGMLALTLLAVVALAAIVAWTAPGVAAGFVLLLGCVGALLGNVIRAARR